MIMILTEHFFAAHHVFFALPNFPYLSHAILTRNLSGFFFFSWKISVFYYLLAAVTCLCPRFLCQQNSLNILRIKPVDTDFH